jgi:hypothetical protein
MIYYAGVRPHVARTRERLELFNEVMIMLICYQMMFFSEWWGDPRKQQDLSKSGYIYMSYGLRYACGYVFVGAMGFTLAANVAAMAYGALQKKQREREFQWRQTRWREVTLKNVKRAQKERAALAAAGLEPKQRAGRLVELPGGRRIMARTVTILDAMPPERQAVYDAKEEARRKERIKESRASAAKAKGIPREQLNPSSEEPTKTSITRKVAARGKGRARRQRESVLLNTVAEAPEALEQQDVGEETETRGFMGLISRKTSHHIEVLKDNIPEDEARPADIQSDPNSHLREPNTPPTPAPVLGTMEDLFSMPDHEAKVYNFTNPYQRLERPRWGDYPDYIKNFTAILKNEIPCMVEGENFFGQKVELTPGQHAKLKWLATNTTRQEGMDQEKVREERRLATEFMENYCTIVYPFAATREPPKDAGPTRVKADFAKLEAIAAERRAWTRQQWEDHNREQAAKAEESRNRMFGIEHF